MLEKYYLKKLVSYRSISRSKIVITNSEAKIYIPHPEMYQETYQKIYQEIYQMYPEMYQKTEEEIEQEVEREVYEELKSCPPEITIHLPNLPDRLPFFFQRVATNLNQLIQGVKSLELTYLTISPKDARSIVSFLKFQNVEHLGIPYCKINHKAAGILTKAVNKYHVKSLDISYLQLLNIPNQSNITPEKESLEKLKLFNTFLSLDNPFLENLKFSNSVIDQYMIKALVNFLLHNPQLKYINLEDSKFKGLEQIEDIIPEIPTWNTDDTNLLMRFACSHINDMRARSLITLFQYLAKDLNFLCNKITGDKAQIFAGLRPNNTIKGMNFSCNKLTSNGLKQIQGLIEEWPITHLHIVNGVCKKEARAQCIKDFIKSVEKSKLLFFDGLLFDTETEKSVDDEEYNSSSSKNGEKPSSSSDNSDEEEHLIEYQKQEVSEYLQEEYNSSSSKNGEKPSNPSDNSDEEEHLIEYQKQEVSEYLQDEEFSNSPYDSENETCSPQKQRLWNKWSRQIAEKNKLFNCLNKALEKNKGVFEKKSQDDKICVPKSLRLDHIEKTFEKNRKVLEKFLNEVRKENKADYAENESAAQQHTIAEHENSGGCDEMGNSPDVLGLGNS